MNRKRFLMIAVLVLLPSLARPQTPRPRATAPEKLDPRIVAAVKQVSAAKIKENIEKLASFGTRHTLSAADAEAIAKGRGIGAAREWIKSEYERYSQACGGCLTVEMQSYVQETGSRIPKPTEIVNVVATMRGTDEANAGRIYLVTGHYDSRASDPMDAASDAPGANDDASGTAVSLECARVLSQHKFPATIIFMAVAGEEQGLNGARHFAKTAKEKSWNIEAVLNNDIVGGDRSKEQDATIVRVFSEGIPASATEQDIRQIRNLGGENDSTSRQLARYVRETGQKYVAKPFEPKMIFRRDRYLRGGDHTAFNEFGYAAVRFSEYREDYNHQHNNVRTESGVEYGDLPKFVDFAYVANVARVNLATLAALASAPAPPANVRLLTRNLENDSTVEWEASPGGLAVSYEVVWRPTTAAEWENVESAGNATRMTLKRSKDNVIFAVRAVGKDGHRSLPVVARPQGRQ